MNSLPFDVAAQTLDILDKHGKLPQPPQEDLMAQFTKDIDVQFGTVSIEGSVTYADDLEDWATPIEIDLDIDEESSPELVELVNRLL